MIDMTEYGWHDSMMPIGEAGIAARVTAVHRGRFELICCHGSVYGVPKTSIYMQGDEMYPAVGDFVLIDYQPSSDSIIVKTLPRRTLFLRKDPGPVTIEQVVAANFDMVYILTSLNKDFNIPRLERYLALAWQSGALPVVVLTKADLAEDTEDILEMVQQTAFGVDVYIVSIVTGQGLEELKQSLIPKQTVIFLGTSGVGKSSLLNALAGHTLMDVGEIRERDSRGRHTTTHRQLFMLPSGVMIIDTPGMRLIGMWDSQEGLTASFSDIEMVLERPCRFSNCSHSSEAGCSIRDALATGELSQQRWKAYLKLKKELEYVERRATIGEMLSAKRRDKHRKSDVKIKGGYDI